MARELALGGCLDIAGSTQKCSWGNILLTTNPITVAFLFKLRANGSSSFDVVYGHSNASWFFILNGTAGSRGKIAFNFQSSGGEKTSGYLTDNLTLDTWYVVIGSHDSGGGANNTRLRVYTAEDGVLVEEKLATNAFSISTTANSLVAGYDSVRSLSVNAQFKKLTIWSRFITEAECDAFALNQHVDRASLELETHCNEAEGTTLRNTAARDYLVRPGTLSGSATIASNIPSSFARTRNSSSSRNLTRDFGTCLSFDGATGVVSKLTETAYNLVNFTVSMWVKGAGNTAGRSIFAEGSTASNNPIFSLQTDNPATGKLNAFIRTTAGSILKNTNSSLIVFDNRWHHVVWSDGSGAAKLYVDTVLDPTNYSYTRGTIGVNRTGIGALIRGATSQYFLGFIDDVTVFDTALSLSEIQSLYATSKRKTGVIIDYKFNEASGSTATDSSGNGSDGTITGATYSVVSPMGPRVVNS